MRRVARPLLYVGTIAIVVALGRFHAQFIGHYVFHTDQRLPWNLTYAVLLCAAAYGMGLPEFERLRWPWGASIGAAVVGALAVSAVQLVLGSVLLPRFVVFVSVVVLPFWFVCCARVAAIGRARDEGRDRVVLVALSGERADFERELAHDLERPAVLAGGLLPEEAHPSGPLAKPLIEAVVADRGTVVVLDRTASLDETIVEQAAALHEAGLRVRSLSLFYDEWMGKVPLSELERMSLMFDVGDLHRRRYGRTKRLLDVGVALVGLALLVVVTPMVLLGNAVANRGPLFYRQPRVGKGNSEFWIVKFRTMQPGSATPDWTTENDRRMTPWGRVLRKSHLDELPQVLNILRGEQSVVGPRPEQPRYVAELRTKIPFYDLRHLVRPGLTGWAQVKYRYGANELDAMEKLQYDFYYLRHQQLGLDLRIIGRTLRSVLGRSGR